MKQFFAILFLTLLCSAASADEQNISPLALQQARQVAKKASVSSLSNDAFILGSLVAKKEKRLQAINSNSDQKSSVPVSE